MMSMIGVGLWLMVASAGQDDQARADPFRSPLVDAEMPPVTRTVGGPLVHFELEQLRVVGLVVNVATPVAMVEDPTGQGHMVRVGMLMGTNGAQVKSITRDGIILEQTIHTFALGHIKTQVSMPLAR